MPASTAINVRSVNSLMDFRAVLAKFGAGAKTTLDEVDMEARRLADWIRHDQLVYWKQEYRRASELVARARSELERCQRNSYDDERASCIQEKKAYDKAKAYVRHCEEKAQVVRRWGAVVEKALNEYIGRVSQFRSMLENDIPGALSQLEKMVIALEKYAQIESTARSPAMAGAEAGSASRGSGPAIPKDEHPAQAFRQHTPDQETRDSLDYDAGPEPEGLDTIEETAENLADGLDTQPQLPQWTDKVVVDLSAMRSDDVYLERISSPEGDSGWYVGAAEAEQDGEPNLSAMSLLELVERRPHWAQCLALPPGHLAVYSGEKITAVLDEDGRDVFKTEAN